jgi:hypothetical protein
MRRHRTDLTSLIFGLFFLTIVGFWAVSTYTDWRIDWQLPNFGWFVAGTLILIGVLGLLASMRRQPAAPPTPPAGSGSRPADATESADTAAQPGDDRHD